MEPRASSLRSTKLTPFRMSSLLSLHFMKRTIFQLVLQLTELTWKINDSYFFIRPSQRLCLPAPKLLTTAKEAGLCFGPQILPAHTIKITGTSNLTGLADVFGNKGCICAHHRICSKGLEEPHFQPFFSKSPVLWSKSKISVTTSTDKQQVQRVQKLNSKM